MLSSILSNPILLGLFLVVGGEMIVKSAVAIARYCGVAESVIGLTIVALGTSLPELATSAAAVLCCYCYMRHT